MSTAQLVRRLGLIVLTAVVAIWSEVVWAIDSGKHAHRSWEHDRTPLTVVDGKFRPTGSTIDSPARRAR